MQINPNATGQNQFFILTVLFLGAVGFFMVWVYLALAIEERFDLSKPMIGAIAGSMVIFTSGFSWLGGKFGDHFGQIKVLRFGLIFYVPVTFIMAVTHSLFAMIAMIAAIGIIRSLTTPATKALCMMADDGSGRMFRFRYLSITAAFATVGTIAMLWKPEHHAHLFYLATLIMAATALAIFILPQSFVKGDKGTVKILHKKASVPILPIIVLIGFGGALLILLSQFETSLPLHLNDAFGRVIGAKIYSFQVIWGSIFGFVFALIYDQFAVKWTKIKPVILVIYGVVAVIVSSFMIYQSAVPIWIYLGVMIFVTAEVMLFPMIDSMAGKFMNDRNQGQIMGLLEIRQLSFFIGPVIGGFMLEISPQWFIGFQIVIVALLGLCYFMLTKLD